MAHYVEPMDVEDIESHFDNKENTYQNYVQQLRSEKVYEELDVSEQNMKLRMSCTPMSSPMSRTLTGTAPRDAGDYSSIENTLGNTKHDSNFLSKSMGDYNDNDTLKMQSNTSRSLTFDSQCDDNKNTTVLRVTSGSVSPGNSVNNNVTVAVDSHFSDDNISFPSSSSSHGSSSPIAMTPTKEIPKTSSSPIMRGLKSVLNMFRPSQSPIIPMEASSPLANVDEKHFDVREKNTPNHENRSPIMSENIVASTPLAQPSMKRDEDNNLLNRNSLVFNEDIISDLQWNDDTTIIFNKNKMPVRKICTPTSSSSFSNTSDSIQPAESTVESLKYGTEVNEKEATQPGDMVINREFSKEIIFNEHIDGNEVLDVTMEDLTTNCHQKNVSITLTKGIVSGTGNHMPSSKTGSIDQSCKNLLNECGLLLENTQSQVFEQCSEVVSIVSTSAERSTSSNITKEIIADSVENISSAEHELTHDKDEYFESSSLEATITEPNEIFTISDEDYIEQKLLKQQADTKGVILETDEKLNKENLRCLNIKVALPENIDYQADKALHVREELETAKLEIPEDQLTPLKSVPIKLEIAEQVYMCNDVTTNDKEMGFHIASKDIVIDPVIELCKLESELCNTTSENGFSVPSFQDVSSQNNCKNILNNHAIEESELCNITSERDFLMPIIQEALYQDTCENILNNPPIEEIKLESELCNTTSENGFSTPMFQEESYPMDCDIVLNNAVTEQNNLQLELSNTTSENGFSTPSFHESCNNAQVTECNSSPVQEKVVILKEYFNTKDRFIKESDDYVEASEVAASLIESVVKTAEGLDDMEFPFDKIDDVTPLNEKNVDAVDVALHETISLEEFPVLKKSNDMEDLIPITVEHKVISKLEISSTEGSDVDVPFHEPHVQTSNTLNLDETLTSLDTSKSEIFSSVKQQYEDNDAQNYELEKKDSEIIVEPVENPFVTKCKIRSSPPPTKPDFQSVLNTELKGYTDTNSVSDTITSEQKTRCIEHTVETKSTLKLLEKSWSDINESILEVDSTGNQTVEFNTTVDILRAIEEISSGPVDSHKSTISLNDAKRSLEQSVYFSADNSLGEEIELQIPEMSINNQDLDGQKKDNPFASNIKIRQSPVRTFECENPFVSRSKLRASPPVDIKTETFTDKIEQCENKISELPSVTNKLVKSLLITGNEQQNNPFATVSRIVNSPPRELITNSSFIKTQNPEEQNVDHDITVSYDSSPDKDITIREVGTEDEDTLEGPDFNISKSSYTNTNTLEQERNVESTSVQKTDFAEICEEKKQWSKTNDFLTSSSKCQIDKTEQFSEETFDNRELFIDAEAFDFLMSKNVNEVNDCGKESLFLKFDPLCAKKVNSEGIVAALNNFEKVQTDHSINVETVRDENVSYNIDETTITSEEVADEHDSLEENLQMSSTVVEKPMMAVIPAVNNEPIVVQRHTSFTPTRSARQSMTFTSPAIAAIDRLLSLSGNSSPIAQNLNTSRQMRETNEEAEAVVHLEQLMAEKKQQIDQLRSEGMELKTRISGLEIQMKSLEDDNSERLLKINELNNQLAEKTKINKNMVTVVEEYERTIAGLTGENEQEKKRHEEEKLLLIQERDEQTAHLVSMEVSFSDLHTKYEKSKQIILSYKANEDVFRKSIQEHEENIRKMEDNYNLLKQHAASKINRVCDEIEKIKKSHESEVVKLTAQLKRKEMCVTSLEETLAQKIKANKELTAICDELISKVS